MGVCDDCEFHTLKWFKKIKNHEAGWFSHCTKKRRCFEAELENKILLTEMQGNEKSLL